MHQPGLRYMKKKCDGDGDGYMMATAQYVMRASMSQWVKISLTWQRQRDCWEVPCFFQIFTAWKIHAWKYIRGSPLVDRTWRECARECLNVVDASSRRRPFDVVFSNADATRGLKQYETPMAMGIYKQSPLSHDNQRILGSLKLLVKKKKPLKRERKKNTHTPYPNHYSAPPPSPPPLFSAGL